MKTYHYCALSQTPDGNLHYGSGIAKFDTDLVVDGAYETLCGHVGSRMNPPRDGKQVVLLSLTVIADDAAPSAAPPVSLMRF